MVSFPQKKMLPEGTMSSEDRMTIDERRKYLRMMQKRYREAGRKERVRLLDEMEAVTELHRKSLIRSMSSSLERRPRRRQRGRTYGPEVDDALRVIAESTDYICAERLTPNLPLAGQAPGGSQGVDHHASTVGTTGSHQRVHRGADLEPDPAG
jgi:hypothetical protein